MTNYFKRSIAVVFLLISTLLSTGCRSGVSAQVGPEMPMATQDAAAAAPVADVNLTDADANTAIEAFDYKTGFQETPYTPVEIKPSVKSYTIQPDLSNIANLDSFPTLTDEQKRKIAENGFVVTPSEREQLFYIYEDNLYNQQSGFVTVDTVLQVYHIFFDYALRTSETEEFYPRLQELNSGMLTALLEDYAAVTNGTVKQEVLKAIGFFGVAASCLGDSLPANLPDEAMELIRQELVLIEGQSLSVSPLIGVEIDYSQFVPRGHYTRSETLTKYFKAMMWYGLAPFRLYDGFGNRDEASTLCGMVITNALFKTETGAVLWESIYSSTSFFSGNSDDINPFQYKSIMDQIYGLSVNLDALSEAAKLDAFYKEADKLPKPLISQKRSEDGNRAEGLQFRFMGQRYIADSEILQELSAPILRPVPTGLDVFAVLGSDRGAQLIKQYFKPEVLWPGYAEKFQKLYDKFSSLTGSDWRSNIYTGWLWTLQALIGEYGEGYPSFMQNAAWQDKSLATALGSWAELRHDTILYGKQSGAEKGGGSEIIPPSYVEPNPELYNKLLWLTRHTRENLAARGILNEKIQDKMNEFEDVLSFLLDCSIKELKGEALSEDENAWILSYGGRLERLTISFADGDIVHWYEIETDTDKNMAVIADVHTVFANQYSPVPEYLEEAVGHAAEIYAAVPVGDEIYLTRGAVFDYYEFLSEKRLTDEEWQSMLKDGTAPERPEWTGSFRS